MPAHEPTRVRRYATTPDLIADTLRDEILRGAIPPGQPLRQEDLASRFGVSRLPVRDALVRLEAQGLVEVFPNRGAFVIALSADEVREVFDMRILLEGDLIERAVPRMTPDDWRTIDAARADAAHHANGPQWTESDWRFHRALYEPAARPRQLATIETLRGTVARYWAADTAFPIRRTELLADHDAIVEACRARASVAARRRLEEHLRRASELVLGVTSITPP
jgi:DNA-binding GntR family transcriptional regulator